MSTEPITGQTYQDAGSQQTDALQNAILNYFAAWTNCVVLTVGDNAPPDTPTAGDRYIVGDTPTGAWAGHAGELAVYRGGWQFYAALEGVAVHNLGDGADWIYEGSGSWALKASGGGGGSTIDIVTEGSAFTATVADHAGKDRIVLAGGDVTFDSAESYTAGQAFNIRATTGIDLVEDGVTLTPPAGGTLALDADMAVTVIMTSGTTGIVIGQTVPA